MPLLKSPGQILKVWKRSTADYLKLNQLKELPKAEKDWAVKFVMALERFRKLAQQRGLGNKIAPMQFADSREQCLTPLEKLRKLFTPRKTQDKVDRKSVV